jgi:hypothetical protein
MIAQISPEQYPDFLAAHPSEPGLCTAALTITPFLVVALGSPSLWVGFLGKARQGWIEFTKALKTGWLHNGRMWYDPVA